MTEELLRSFAERAVQLKLMGFTTREWKPIVANEIGYKPSKEDWTKIEYAVKASLRDFTLDADEVNQDLNLFLKRSQWIQGQLLGIFNNMIRNYNAISEGRLEHEPDPVTGESEPVLPVKPGEIAALGEKILKLDQERLAAQMAYPGALHRAQQALSVSQHKELRLADGAYAALTNELWDDPIDDPEDDPEHDLDEQDTVDADYKKTE